MCSLITKLFTIKKLSIYGLLPLLVTALGCNKNPNETEPTPDIGDQVKSVTSDMIILGNQLQNPYTVVNMQLAYNNLKNRYGNDVPNISINETHKYVKFKPESEEEYIDMVSDTMLELFTYPLDYEILSVGGLYYHDSSIPDSLPTYHYASIEAGYTPNTIVNYEVLANLCIPEITSYYTQNLNDTTLDLLVDEALIITGNYEEDTTSTKATRGSRYHPEGKITVHDDIVNNGVVNVENVQVRARRWFTVHTTRTNETGDFYMMETFKRPCNYSLVWTTFRYYITNGIWFPAVYNGPKKKNEWDLHIANNGKSFKFATLLRAAHRYHKKNIGGLKRPGVWTKLKICYIDGEGTGMNIGNHWQTFIFGLAGLPNIMVWGKYTDNGNYKSSDVLFSTTIHELGHASHISLINDFQFIQVTPIIRESWANCVEWYITKIEYNELGEMDFDDPFIETFGDHMQNWHKPLDYSDYEDIYTPVFIDLFDDYIQALERGTLPADRCPDGGTFDGSNCFVVQPPYGESVYIEDYTFYYTPQNCCDCPIPGTYYNGQTCFVLSVPLTSIPFMYSGKGYIYPAGDSDYPYDQLKGYTMDGFENDILKHSYGLSSLKGKLKENLPVEMTDRHIDVFIDFFFNL